MPTTFLPLCLYLHTRLGTVSGIAFIDSTPLPVCHNRRIERHKVFAGLAARGKTSMGWFYGFKLHLIVNDQGELISPSSCHPATWTTARRFPNWLAAVRQTVWR